MVTNLGIQVWISVITNEFRNIFMTPPSWETKLSRNVQYVHDLCPLSILISVLSKQTRCHIVHFRTPFSSILKLDLASVHVRKYMFAQFTNQLSQHIFHLADCELKNIALHCTVSRQVGITVTLFQSWIISVVTIHSLHYCLIYY